MSYPPISSKEEGGLNKTAFPLHRFDQVFKRVQGLGFGVWVWGLGFMVEGLV